MKSFDQTFSKVCAVKVAEALSPSAEGEISPRRFFLRTFSLRLLHAKKKWRNDFVRVNEL
jgi:hypothetical protein